MKRSFEGFLIVPDAQRETEEQKEGVEVSYYGKHNLSRWRRELERASRKRDRNPEEADIIENNARKEIDFEMTRFVAIYLDSQFEERRGDAARFISDVLLHDEVKALIADTVDHEQPLDTQIAELLRSRKLSRDVFRAMLEAHGRDMIERGERFKKQFEEWKGEFLQRVEEEIASGFLPIDLEKARKRIHEIDAVLADPMETSDMGSFRLGLVKMSDRVPEDVRRHTIFHELTHGISGRVMGEREGEFKVREHVKLGLRFAEQKAGSALPMHKLERANEAVAETIALRLSEEGDRGFYLIERASLNVITNHMNPVSTEESTVPLAMFIEAFFEDFIPKDGEVVDDVVLPIFDELEKRVLECTGKSLEERMG